MKKITFLIALFFITTISNAQLEVGSTAPDFTATDINGNPYTLSTLLASGKTVIIDFFTAMCYPCWQYHTSGVLETINAAYGPNGSNEVVVFGIECDYDTGINALYGLGPTQTQGDFVTGTNYPIIDDASIASLYQIVSTPTVIVICPNGIISHKNGWIYSLEPQLSNIITTSCSAAGSQNLVKALDNSSSFCANNGSFIANIKNYGANNIVSASLNLKENGTVIATKNTIGVFNQFATKSVNFDPITINPSATYSFEITSINYLPNPFPNYSIGNLTLTNENQQVEQNIEVHVYTDSFPAEISWRMLNSSESVVASGGSYVSSWTDHVHNVTLPDANDCYSIELFDTGGDGWTVTTSNTSFEVFSNGISVYDIPRFNFGYSLRKSYALTTSTQLGNTTLNKNKYNVYPNPTNGILFFNVETSVNVDVVDIMGKIIFSKKNVSNASSIDLSFLQKGIYFAKISNEGFTKTEKIILN